MKKLATIFAATALLALFAGSAMAANQVRISQVYGAGGSGGATYKQKYVEIFNSGGSAVDVSNWAIAYGSSTGSWNSTGGATYTNQWVFPAGTSIQPCGYLLVAFVGTGTAGVDITPTVTPDFLIVTPTPIISMSGSNGKIMLSQTVPANGVACGAEGVVIVDKIAYGPSSTCAEGTPTASLSVTLSAVRNGGGLTDTDNNSADFTVMAPPMPHSGVSGYRNTGCQITPTQHGTWGALKSIYR